MRNAYVVTARATRIQDAVDSCIRLWSTHLALKFRRFKRFRKQIDKANENLKLNSFVTLANRSLAFTQNGIDTTIIYKSCLACLNQPDGSSFPWKINKYENSSMRDYYCDSVEIS